jgi:16S rRNA (uracil1498-N3)-methyltransferase
VFLAVWLAAAFARTPAGGPLVLDPGVDQSLVDAITRPASARPASAHASISEPVAILTGPEGGLAGFELEMATGAGFTPVGLGPRVLRAETAPVIAVALVRAASKS